MISNGVMNGAFNQVLPTLGAILLGSLWQVT